MDSETTPTEELERGLRSKPSESGSPMGMLNDLEDDKEAQRSNEAFQVRSVPTRHDTGSTLMTRSSTRYDPNDPRMLERTETAISQHQSFVGRSTTSLRKSRTIPPMGGNKDLPPMLPDVSVYLVDFDGPGDPLFAQNWKIGRKVKVAVVLGYTTLVAAWGSSIFSSATTEVAAAFGLSTEVSLLGLTLYVLGFVCGPMIFAPISELYGRKMPVIASAFGMTVFNFAVATAKDTQTLFICRFFTGLFGAGPLAVVGAAFSDLFDNNSRGKAMSVFAATVFAGPLLAPIVGGFIATSYLGWRWTAYITGIMAALALILDLIFLEETYAPAILVAKASEMRRLTGNWGIHAKMEEIEVDFKELLQKNLSRPLRMLFTEPIIFLISVYCAFIYGILYLFLIAYPIVFQQGYGMRPRCCLSPAHRHHVR